MQESSPAQEKRRVAAYCRVSTDQEEQEGSFELQKAYYENLIAKDPAMELAGIYGDKGKTGREIYARPGLQRLIADCEGRKIDLVLCKSISRFSRNMGDAVRLIRRLKSLGVTLEFEKEGFSTTNMVSEILLCILSAIAEEESNSISENVRLAHQQRAIEGRPATQASYGFRSKQGTWRIEPNEARRVKAAFRMACRGSSYADIGRALQAMEDSEGTDRKWSRASVCYLLRNERYKGDILTNKIITARGRDGKRRCVPNNGMEKKYYLKGHHDPIVSGETFDIVQMMIERKMLQRSKRHYQGGEQQILEEATAAAAADVLLNEEGAI